MPHHPDDELPTQAVPAGSRYADPEATHIAPAAHEPDGDREASRVTGAPRTHDTRPSTHPDDDPEATQVAARVTSDETQVIAPTSDRAVASERTLSGEWAEGEGASRAAQPPSAPAQWREDEDRASGQGWGAAPSGHQNGAGAPTQEIPFGAPERSTPSSGTGAPGFRASTDAERRATPGANPGATGPTPGQPLWQEESARYAWHEPRVQNGWQEAEPARWGHHSDRGVSHPAPDAGQWSQAEARAEGRG